MPIPLAPVVAGPISLHSRETGRFVTERTSGSAGARRPMNSDAQAAGRIRAASLFVSPLIPSTPSTEGLGNGNGLGWRRRSSR
jgi:hypothetical protein